MMLNGLQTSSKTLPLDLSAAKLQSVDAETTEPVSFGELLKLKEKQLQQEQEVGASIVAAAFASLQTPQLVAPLPIRNMETVEKAITTEVSKASSGAIFQPVTTPVERSDPSLLSQNPASHVSVTESIPSVFPAVLDSANENASQQSSVMPELSSVLSTLSFGKTTTSTTTNFPIPDQPVQFTEQVLTAELAKIAPAKGQILASIPSQNSEDISASSAIKANDPAVDNSVSTVSTTAKAYPTFFSGTTTNIDTAREEIKIDTRTVSQTTKNPEVLSQSLPVNSIISEDKTSEGTDSPFYPASRTVVMPNEEGGTKVNDFLISNGTKSNNSEAALIPNPVIRVRPNTDARKTPASSAEAIEVTSQESELQTLEVPATSQSTKAQSTETSKTSEFGNESGFVQPEIKENIHFYKPIQKDNNTASGPLPVETTEGVPTRNASTETDNSTIQQAYTTYRGQQSKSSSPELSAPSLFSPNVDDTEKMEKQITALEEDEINAGPLHLENTVDEIVSTPEIEPVDNPVSEPILKQQIAAPTNVDPGSVDVAPANSTVEFPSNLNFPHEVEMSAAGKHIQEQEFSARLDQPGSQDVKTQVEQSSFEKVGTNETKYGQTLQLSAIPAIDDAPLADDRAGFNSFSASERIVEKLPDAQGKIDLKNISQGAAGRIDGMADPEKRTLGTANTFESNTTTQMISTERGDIRSDAGEMTSPFEVQNRSPIENSSDLSSTFAEDTPRFSQFAGANQEMGIPKTALMEKEGISASKNSWAETGTIHTFDQPETVSVFRIRNDVPNTTSAKPARDLISGEPLKTPAQTDATLEIDPEIRVFNQQDIISRPEQDLSPVATKNEENKALVFEAAEQKRNVTPDSSKIQEKSSMNFSSDLVVPTGSEFVDREAGISLRTSSVAEEVLESVFNTHTTPAVQSFQSMTGSTKTQKNQSQIEVEIPLSEHVVADVSEIQATDFEINAQKIATEPNVEEKAQVTETNLSNLGAAVVSEPLEMPDGNTATVTVDLTGHVLSKTDSAVGNKDVADGELPVRESRISSNRGIETSRLTGSQSRSVFSSVMTDEIEKSDFATIESESSTPGKTVNMLRVDMGISAAGDLSKSSTDENISIQTTQGTKTAESVPQAIDMSSSQPEVTKAARAKNGETLINVELPMDQSVQNGTRQLHENKSKSDVDVKPVDFNSPGGGAEEMINTRTESINDVRPAIHQAPGVVEIVREPIAPALPNAPTVDGPDGIRKPKQIENDEKTLPVEKQSRLNQTPGFAAPSNGPVREMTATYPGGNISSNQLHGDVKEVVDHLIRHINSNLKNGPTSMRLQLSPRELGAIDVQMVSDSQGVHVTFFAEQSSTGKLLETQLDQLRASLVDSGVHLLGLDIGQHNQSGQKGGSFEQSPNFTRDFSRNFPEAQTVSQEKPSLERSLGRTTDIDYLI